MREVRKKIHVAARLRVASGEGAKDAKSCKAMAFAHVANGGRINDHGTIFVLGRRPVKWQPTAAEKMGFESV